MAPDPLLVERTRAALADQARQRLLDLREKHMFGGLAFMLNGKMAGGVVGDELMVRVGPDAYEVSLARPHVRPMDFTGKPMRGYVFVGRPAARPRRPSTDGSLRPPPTSSSSRPRTVRWPARRTRHR